MSSVYVNEPVTNGHVILTTTHGPIDIHLWCNECPTTTKYFLQLCLDEYYNNMIFHRILPNLLIQTGLIRYNNDTSHNMNDTSTTTTTSSIMQQQQQQHDLMKEYHKVINSQESYNRRFYELHSRIKFSHRGQVAMALPVNDDTNRNSRSKSNIDNNEMDDDYYDSSNIQEIQPQFFITTDEAPYLNGKHVLFGTIVGPTIFNAIRINQYTTSSTSTGSNDNNNDTTIDDNAIIDYDSAPRIVSIKIIHNPFEETMIRSIRIIPWKVINHYQNDSTTQVHNNVKKKKRKGKFDINVLSFGDEIDTTTTTTKRTTTARTKNENINTNNDKGNSKIDDQTNNQLSNENNNTMSFQSISQSETIQQIFENNNSNDRKVQHEISNNTVSGTTTFDNPSTAQQEAGSQHNKNDDHVNHTTHKPDMRISLVEARRAKYLSRQRLSSSKSGNNNNNNNNHSDGKTHNKQQRDDETYNKLIQFRRKIHDTILQANDKSANMNNNYDNSLASRMARRVQQQQQQQQAKEEDKKSGHSNESDPKVWIQTKFQCTKHIDLLSGDNKDAMEEYEVIEDQQYDGKIRNKKRFKSK